MRLRMRQVLERKKELWADIICSVDDDDDDDDDNDDDDNDDDDDDVI